MKITVRPAVTTQAITGTIRDDWATTQGGYTFTDDGTQVVVTITSKLAVTAVAANPTATPPVAAVPGSPNTRQFTFTLYAAGAAYATANALNGGQGYGNADLVAAISTYLSTVAVQS